MCVWVILNQRGGWWRWGKRKRAEEPLRGGRWAEEEKTSVNPLSSPPPNECHNLTNSRLRFNSILFSSAGSSSSSSSSAAAAEPWYAKQEEARRSSPPPLKSCEERITQRSRDPPQPSYILFHDLLYLIVLFEKRGIILVGVRRRRRRGPSIKENRAWE